MNVEQHRPTLDPSHPTHVHSALDVLPLDHCDLHDIIIIVIVVIVIIII